MIQLHRETDASRINALLNQPEIRPWIANGDSAVDVSAQVANPDNILLMGEHGGCMFFKLQEGIYEVHTQVSASARGEWTDQLTQACAYWMFMRTTAWDVLTRVPEGHVAARAAAIRRGMRFEFTRPQECVFKNEKVDVHIYSIRLQDWIKQADALDATGREFHDMLHAAAERYGVTDPAHDDDPNHNRYVGAAVEMARHGQVRKAVLWYNRWAMASRHPPIALLRDGNPAMVRIDHGFVLTATNGVIEVQHGMA